jgi:hypothetical protein
VLARAGDEQHHATGVVNILPARVSRKVLA